MLYFTEHSGLITLVKKCKYNIRFFIFNVTPLPNAFTGTRESWSPEQDQDCRGRSKTEVSPDLVWCHKAKTQIPFEPAVNINALFVVLQEKLEPILGGVGREQFGFLQGS